MQQRPLVSVGIPVYNAAEWLGETIQSILDQTLTDFELILADNASTDGSARLCLDYAERDHRIRYFRNSQNLGAPANYNLCFEHATGKYFKWNSASDPCRPRLLETCVAVLESRPDVSLAYPRTELLYEDGRREAVEENLALDSDRPSERHRQYIDNVGLNHAMNGVMRTADLARTALHEPFYSSDICLMAEMTLMGKFYQVPEWLFVRRVTPRTASAMATEEDLQRYFDPELKSKMLFQDLKLHCARFRAVHRAQISLAEKAALYRSLLRRVRWGRKRLLVDIVGGIRKSFGRAT